MTQFTRLTRAALFVLALAAAPLDAQSGTIYVRGEPSGSGRAVALPFDTTLGVKVTIPKLDVTNDEIAIGASAGQTGGISKSLFLADSVFTVIKASAGRLYGILAPYNANAAVRFIKIYDKATAPDPAGGDVPVLVVPISTSGSIGNVPSIMIPGGVAMANGIGIICVTSIAHTSATHCLYPENAVTVLYK